MVGLGNPLTLQENVLPASISQILSSGLAHDPLHPEAVRNVFLSEQAEESAAQVKIISSILPT